MEALLSGPPRNRISVTVSPGAERSEVVGRHGEGWKAGLRAPAERGRANQALVDLLARALGLAREDVRIVGGQTSRRKVVEIVGLDAEEVGRRLDAAAQTS